MFHLNEKPSPPRYGGRVTSGQAVDSSAIVIDARIFRVHDMIEMPQKIDRFQVFAPAILVRDPFAFLARVIQVEHRRHRIHAQPVDVEAVAPEQRVRRQEIPDLVPAEVEDERAPILVRAFARVFVLVKRGAIELRQRPIVAREMRRHPIHDHANARFMQGVDQKLEVVRACRSGWSAHKTR